MQILAYSNGKEKPKCFSVPAHGLTMFGTNSNVPIPGYMDPSGVPVSASSFDETTEALGLITVQGPDTLCYEPCGSYVKAVSHGFTPGDTLYLQDNGSLGNTPGTIAQKIYEVVDENCLLPVCQPMRISGGNTSIVSGTSPTGEIIATHDDGTGNLVNIRESVSPLTLNPTTGVATYIDESGAVSTWKYLKAYERFPLPQQNITNVGAVLNPLTYHTGSFGTFSSSISSSGTSVTFSRAGVYDVSLVADFFDGNSPRVAHRAFFKINGAIYSRLSGANYLRDEEAHDDSSTVYKDFVVISAGDILTIDLQTTSSLLNTTIVTSASRLLIQEL